MATIDWAFSEEGDLILGDPKVDDDGYVMYQHWDGSISTDKGDDGVEIRDLGVSTDIDAEKQIILNRLRTDSPDWYHHPSMAGNLTDLVGEPNTRSTGDLGVRSIVRALTYKNLYNSKQLNVRAVPLSANEIVFVIDIMKFGSDVIRFPITFNLETGLMDVYEVPKSSEEGV